MPGNYLIKQRSTTDKEENYTYTSIGFSRLIEAGQTVNVVGYENKLSGSYIFSGSPLEVHVPLNSKFDSGSQGIIAFTLNRDGTLGSELTSTWLYPYYNNVNTSIPGEYVSIYMGYQTSYSEGTSHVLKVIVDPEPPIIAGPVIINYLDEDGNKIQREQIINGNVGDLFDAGTSEYQLSIEGYELDDTRLPVTKGYFTDKEQTINYIYKKLSDSGETSNKKGMLTIHYVDENANPIAADLNKKDVIGAPYDARKYIIEITGWDLDETKRPKNEQGVYGETPQSVTYIYKKHPEEVVNTGKVTISYQDIFGNQLAPDKTIEGVIGTTFDATSDEFQTMIPGYTLDKENIPQNSRGRFTLTTQQIIYIYKQQVIDETPPSYSKETSDVITSTNENLVEDASKTINEKESNLIIDHDKNIYPKKQLPKTGSFSSAGWQLIGGIFIILVLTNRIWKKYILK
ncbi:MucBP domain-containing protein [Enterococcus faecalis]|nr:MucBP domain-containing protein [Enterococcus faecalis]